MITDVRAYRRSSLLGALGALLMLVGDLCLSVIPANTGDSGLFAREAYLSGGFDAWRLLIGSLADWTSRLAPLLGRAEALAMVQAWYDRLAPALLLPYAGMLLLILGSAFAVLTRKTILPRWMLGFHLITRQLILMLIPDIRQMLGAEISNWDFVLSQCSGNAALFIWMLANAIWAGRQE